MRPSTLPSFCAAAVALCLAACERPAATAGRVEIDYWDKWNGFEADAMRAVVNDFNASQGRIHVNFSSISQVNHKLMLSIAGGVPPDIAGIYGYMLPVFAENNALMPLDRMAADAGIARGRYIDIFWRMCSHRGHLWALPTTPSCTALVWNKRLFREAGLDPEKPPRSIAELEQYSERLIRRRPDGSLERIGYVPAQPGWWDPLWGYWFGGDLWNGRDAVTANSPGNLAACEWIASYPRRFGVRDILTFCDGFGTAASPQNPFFTGRVAMEMDGVWTYNFIQNYAPAGFEWGVAAFPTSDPDKLRDTTLVEADELTIPAGAKHPAEAFEFIKYVSSQAAMEKLCLGQRKFTPLADVSADFYRRHPNPYISVYVNLAKSPNAKCMPPMTTWTEYFDDMKNAVNRVWTAKASPREALDEVQAREQQAFERSLFRWERLEPALTAQWSKP